MKWSQGSRREAPKTGPFGLLVASIPWFDGALPEDAVDASRLADVFPGVALLALFVVFALLARPWIPVAPEVAPQLGQAVGNSSLQSSPAHAYGKLPLAFVKNEGQIDKRDRYYAQGAGYGFHFTNGGVRMALAKGQHEHVLDLRFLGARSNVSLERGPPQQPVSSTRRRDTGR